MEGLLPSWTGSWSDTCLVGGVLLGKLQVLNCSAFELCSAWEFNLDELAQRYHSVARDGAGKP